MGLSMGGFGCVFAFKSIFVSTALSAHVYGDYKSMQQLQKTMTDATRCSKIASTANCAHVCDYRKTL